jgi:hypothetical protein
MKILKNFSVVLLCLTVIGTLAFTKAPEKAKALLSTQKVLLDTDFVPITVGGDDFDPDNYQPAPAGFNPNTDCPGAQVVCYIETTHVNSNNTPQVDIDPLKSVIQGVEGGTIAEGALVNGSRVWIRSRP